MKKIAVIGAVIVSVPLVLVAGLLFMFTASGQSNALAASVNQIGNCNLTVMATHSPGYICQVYPSSKPRQSETDYLPIPGAGQADPEAYFTSLIAITTPYQQALISKCYDHWAKQTAYGGQPCGFKGYPGQCTFWALFNWNNPEMLTLSGNANQFYGNAPAQDRSPVSAGPAVGDIVVWNGITADYPSSNGHVAIVVAVETNKFIVSEMNWLSPWVTQYRVVSENHSNPDYSTVEGFLTPSATP